jgi:hypothetical protein
MIATWIVLQDVRQTQSRVKIVVTLNLIGSQNIFFRSMDPMKPSTSWESSTSLRDH